MIEHALRLAYPPDTFLRGPARCSACAWSGELTVPVGAGHPPCACGSGVLYFLPWISAGFVNPAYGG